MISNSEILLTDCLAEYESQERKLTEHLLNTFNNIESYQLVNCKYCYDFWMKLNNKFYLGEVKVRDFKIDKYDTYFFETEKLNNLVMTAKVKKLGIVYINYFKTHEPYTWNYIIFNINARIREWGIKGAPEVNCIYMNDKTFVSKNNKIPKFVIKLKYEKDKDHKGTINLN